ncbi:MAG: YhbY family RNA-binding protein [Methanomassiliicoccales archaeon]
MIKKMSKNELKSKGTKLKSTVHIGKEGLSAAVVDEVGNQLRANKLVKIKILESSAEFKHAIAEELTIKTGAALLEIRGNTILICQKDILK